MDDVDETYIYEYHVNVFITKKREERLQRQNPKKIK